MAKFCKKCGAQLADEAVFCPSCGAAQGPVAPQPQQQVPPQPQPQPQPQYQQPQPQPKPQKTGAPVICVSDIGFKKEDFRFNPIKETISGDLSRYSVFALFLTLFAFFFSLLDLFGRGASMRMAEVSLRLGPLPAFRHILMVLFITSIVWVMFKMFLKKPNYFDHLILAGASALWFLINMIEMIVVGAKTGSGITFAAILFYLCIITATAANVLPLFFRIIRKK